MLPTHIRPNFYLFFTGTWLQIQFGGSQHWVSSILASSNHNSSLNWILVRVLLQFFTREWKDLPGLDKRKAHIWIQISFSGVTEAFHELLIRSWRNKKVSCVCAEYHLASTIFVSLWLQASQYLYARVCLTECKYIVFLLSLTLGMMLRMYV